MEKVIRGQTLVLYSVAPNPYSNSNDFTMVGDFSFRIPIPNQEEFEGLVGTMNLQCNDEVLIHNDIYKVSNVEVLGNAQVTSKVVKVDIQKNGQPWKTRTIFVLDPKNIGSAFDIEETFDPQAVDLDEVDTIAVGAISEYQLFHSLDDVPPSYGGISAVDSVGVTWKLE